VLAQRSKNNYIADNVLQGAYSWEDVLMGAAGKTTGNGVKFDGPGNIVCFNSVTGFRDCLSHIDIDLICCDMYNNDVSQGLDDGIEADYSRGNCRIVRNRLTNCFIGLSSQPGLGGPTYFIRNVLYNITYMPFKLYRFSQGDVCLHNTVVKVGDGMSSKDDHPFDHAYFRNNLFIGGAGRAKWGTQGYNNASGQGIARAACLSKFGPHCDFDYDALGTHESPFAGKLGTFTFSSLEELKKGPYEKHAVQVDMSVFDNVVFPSRGGTVFKSPDLRPKAGSVVVDAGFRLANINDGFLGKAPDIGAYESGQELPTYAPRPDGHL
jgi:hypothetical protein